MNLIGQTVNERYRIKAVLGSGGMATVYEAEDQLLSQTVALKLLTPTLIERAEILERFRAEAHAMLRLHHPNVVAIHGFGDDDQPFIAMELVRGGSASDLLGRMDAPDSKHVHAIIDGVLSGLIHIHASGTIHRDIKPANILLTESGVPKLTDFGIARAVDRNSFQTRAGAIMGTLAFMAPEQRSSATSATEASDLYAVGATLYKLLTRRSTVDLYVREKQEEAFQDLGDDLHEFLSKACAFNASDRYANASEMQAALRSLQENIGAPSPQKVPATTSSKVGNLPPRRDAFVGRTAELEELAAWSASAGNRVISIVGLGGIGKSRLALEFCHQQRHRFTGGMWRIELSAEKSENGLYRTLGSALRLNLEGHEPLDAIVAHLRGPEPCLLIFDNAEEVRAPLRHCLETLIAGVPELRIIVTTRAELHASKETLLGLRELDLRASVALLMQSAGPKYELADKPEVDIQAFERIAQLLEGHPLSLELAATQLDMMAPGQLYDRLQRSLHAVGPSGGLNLLGLLDTGRANTSHSDSVIAALAWSWSILSESEKSTLAQCALFADGFDLEAAEAVVESPHDPQTPPLMVLLQSLRARNLVRIRTPFPGYRRLSIPRLVGAFARAHADHELLAPAALRMAHHFARMGDAERIQHNRTGGGHRHRIAKLEIPNIQRCFEWTLEHKSPHLSALLSLATSELLRNSGPFDGVTAMLRRAHKDLPNDAPLRARLLLEQGRLASNREGLEVAERMLNDATALGDALDIPSVATQARIYLAYVLARTNRLEEAISMAQDAVEKATQTHEQQDLPSAQYCRGHLTHQSGETQKALPDIQSALRGFQQMGDRIREGICFGNLGEYHHYVGDSERAKQCYINAQAIALEHGDKASLVRGHRRWAWIHMDAGDWGLAEASIRSGLQIARELGDIPGEASLVGALGTVAASMGNFELAIEQFQQAEQIYRIQGNADQLHTCRLNICLALEMLDRVDEAFENLERLKAEKNMVPFTRHFVTVIEMKLHIRRENWHTALEIGDRVMGELEKIQAWDRTISVHAYRAICAAALGDDPEPHIAKAEAMMTRLNLADGSQEGLLMAEVQKTVKELQQSTT